jgi:asparagine synthase (glutamine-hydrolysing)
MAGIADIYNMCGIAGIVSMNSALVSSHRLTAMTDALAHRGPDGMAQWINPGGIAGLGHRRLAIIDLSASAAQPMHYRSRYSIVHNGELYNYMELRQQLAGRGYTFTTLSDTEVILAAYDCWKQDCLQWFDGMFAFAIWDEQEQLLFAARDRFGEKPFYYFLEGGVLLFASEIKAINAAGKRPPVNETLLFNFLTLGYTQHPANPTETAFKGVLKLPAAHYFIYKPLVATTVEPQHYWKLDKDHQYNGITEAAALEQFNALFTQSVQQRLRSDVPLGTSLSGGLDSASIAVTIQHLQQAPARLQTFSAVFPGSAVDESQYIQLLTAQQELDNFLTYPTADGFINDIEKLCYHQEGFIGSASVYAQYKVFELAAQHGVKVLLDGQGADELLAGYHKYYHWYWQELYGQGSPLLQQEIDAARQLGVRDEWNWKNKCLVNWPQLATHLVKGNRARRQLYAAGVTRSFASAYGQSYYQLPPPGRLNNVLYYNTIENGLEELLQYADRNSMAHGCEVRLPFLQHQLAAFVFSLPASFKIRQGRTKWLLRVCMDRQLPPEIVWRKDKIGFEPPQADWMRAPAVQEYVMEARKKLAAAGIIEQLAVDKKIQPLDAHAADNFDWRYLVAARLL